MALKASTAAPRTTTGAPAEDDFIPVTSSIRHRLIVTVEGPEKSGKSHFGLTAPGPLYINNLDIGLEGVVEKFVGGKEMFMRDYTNELIMPPEFESLQGAAYLDAVSDVANRVWTKYKSNFMSSLQKGRSSIMDTADEAWELIRLARFGKLSEIKPHHYTPVNQEFQSLINAAFSSDCNLIMLHKMKDEYLNDKSTGKKKRTGYKNAGYAAQVNIRCMREGNNNFSIEILDCRQNPDIIGMVMSNDFATLAQTVFPESSEEEWR